ncbi:secretory phospholipase A2 receptor-like isoform X4 [Acanthochromis polyacanthus]|uniref:secretory phospholipase A2 receptor-like isoform X2 n=1 Tax=Acanthochromis polyacanthus TaxID=80966 RepID=UPI002234B614|nr:secretory phospholipase A2 receptor-like isoform X2 [Acanthochromis polyacanthus]XP_051813120.1 secretory phospholipase A2 receptor-like isoform X3 [Acanthochromis polyacanthus]XP_051813121.1 secretory phospholipase A2 receptor-like isoform X4 [Acanthochromis polyacanthus]
MMTTNGLVVLLLLSGSVLVCNLQPQGAITRFHHVSLMKTWTEAQSYCREKFIDLATIPSQAANTVAQKVAGHGHVWIGLYNGSWRWSQEGKPVENWFLSNVKHNVGSRRCAVLDTYGKWMARDCDVPDRFVCSTLDNRHVVVKRYMSWWDAQTYCRKNHVDLSSVVTNADRDVIQQLLLMSGTGDAWIGLYRSEWAWSDGKKLIYKPLESLPHWGSDCMVMDQSTGTWRSQPCQDRLSFLCYSVVKPSAVSLVKIRLVGGSADLTDPMVQESILLQLRKQLVDGGIQAEVKLRWRKHPDGEVFHREETSPSADQQEDSCRAV